MKKVVVTGATGIIGISLIKYLIINSIEVLAICRPKSDKIKNIPKNNLVKIIECDIDNLSSVSERINEKYDTFFHFAWSGTFGDSRNDVYMQNLNIQYTLDAVKLANYLGCDTFIGAGSQAEYGIINQDLSSNTLTNPSTGYGIAKYSAGKLSAIYSKKLNMRHIWVRILSVYGPNDNNYTMIISTINKLLNGERAEFTKAEQMWDYLYCDDAARALYLIAINGIDQRTYILGSGVCKSLKEYIRIITNHIGNGCEVEFGKIPYSENQVMYLCADLLELTKDTGFIPMIDFEEGIQKTIEFCKSTII
ncbi:NAD-dependent epimerase/dehydratase family protein [Clostridium butyricum]|uniref:NAD(P)-dependent oxidoreductase n=1 Tax=Clostridium butyricum TaxID=1492 RepID=A0AAP9RG99_CLOBU|nr:NAD(P)-dependent oxidoreductase [Clostridium butyricum]MBZ5745192.1 NAD(P)-dependent oxidoreductase [Clostridium butyricum]MDI9207574.1 NAD(P)-dependent oxidoreductase [Clostridium butyricum]QMW92118.1 NAD(P)-dependent oxidoreductase [Clostridium butyricum]BBK75640.1 CDP-abequose synthase [Clostridium butyricum]GEQ24076.1 CDP-abequose synthase [Clostridium butyricum]